MSLLVALLGCVVLGLGLLGLAQPAALLRFVDAAWRRPSGIWLAVVLRLVLGVLLLAVASESRFPTALRVLGGLSLIAALAAPLLGIARLQRFVDWWLERPPAFIRLWSAVALAFGAFLVYAVTG